MPRNGRESEGIQAKLKESQQIPRGYRESDMNVTESERCDKMRQNPGEYERIRKNSKESKKIQ